MEKVLVEKISDLAIKNYQYIQVFQMHKIDFFCEGNITLKEALNDANVKEDVFFDSFNEIQSEGRSYNVKIEEWPLDLLADYIQKTHHRFTDQILVELKKSVNVYLGNDTVRKEQMEQFKIQLELLAKELGGHMKKEELMLFPFIRKMSAARGKIEKPGFNSVENPIDMMIHEHDTAYQLLQKIRMILNDYSVENSRSNIYKSIVHLMSDLDHDLGLHLHLENNILFPKAVALEKNKVNL